jgi:hypothetical protein
MKLWLPGLTVGGMLAGFGGRRVGPRPSMVAGRPASPPRLEAGFRVAVEGRCSPHHDTNDTKSTAPDIRTIPMRIRVPLPPDKRAAETEGKPMLFAIPDRNHQLPDRVIHVRPTGEVLVCRWRQSSVAGQLECVWESERIVAAPVELDPTTVSGDFNRYSGLRAA